MKDKMGDRRAKIYLATGNKHKVEEVSCVLKDYSIDVEAVNIKGIEIQADNVDKIAESSALRAAASSKLPIIVEDTGFFIDALNGFPGPYASYVHDTIGVAGALKLLEGVKSREATFRSAVAFSDSKETLSFIGESRGTIALRARGEQGFGFDSIFEPLDGTGKTFAETDLDEKCAISHRARAIRKFADWYIKRLNL